MIAFLALKGLLWALLAVAGVVALDVGAAELPAAQAWAWARMPSWTGLALASFTLKHLARLAGAWRAADRNPMPGVLQDQDVPVTNPTRFGRWLVLRRIDVLERGQRHPLWLLWAAKYPEAAADVLRAIDEARLHMRGATWHELVAAGHLPGCTCGCATCRRADAARCALALFGLGPWPAGLDLGVRVQVDAAAVAQIALALQPIIDAGAP